MNLRLISNLTSIIATVGPSIKSWIFSDGKFNPKRALVMLAFLITLIVSVNYIGVDETEEVVEMLDEVSDIVGHE